jgi:hypothetical protein
MRKWLLKILLAPERSDTALSRQQQAFLQKPVDDNVKKEGQTISFCRVNAHFQNGVAE